MRICVIEEDMFLCHIRHLYLCYWDYELKAMVQTDLGEEVFSTKWMANEWVEKRIVQHMKLNNFLVYIKS